MGEVKGKEEKQEGMREEWEKEGTGRRKEKEEETRVMER